MGRSHAAEVEGNNRSKTQLIVGIDFVSGAPICSLYGGSRVRKSGLTDDVEDRVLPLVVSLSLSRPTKRLRKILSRNGPVRGTKLRIRYVFKLSKTR